MRGGIVLLGGILVENEADDEEEEGDRTARVAILRSSESEENSFSFEALPPISCAPLANAAALAVVESESDQGHCSYPFDMMQSVMQ
jgi:hypothetical protein